MELASFGSMTDAITFTVDVNDEDESKKIAITKLK